MKKYKVFKLDLAWCYSFLIFDENIKFSDIKADTHLKRLTKENFIGEYQFDDKFLNIFDKKKLNQGFYYFRNLHDKKDTTFDSMDDELF